MDRMKRLAEAIGSLMADEFSGHIKINFSQGSIGRIEKAEEFEDVEVLAETDTNNDKNKGGLS